MVYKNIENTATFASAAGVYSGGDNAIIQMESDDYTFVKTANPESWSGEGQLTYTITLTSISGGDLTDITVTDILPAELTFDPASVQINGATSSNFDDTALPTVRFGTDTALSVTSTNPLIISFQVTQSTP